MSFNFGKLQYWGDAIPHRPTELAYVKQIPLPIGDAPATTHIRTRCMERMSILEPSVPTRQQARESNYVRRQDQMNNQGFVSAIEKPYRGIGDPVYLNTKLLISDALGLPNQGRDGRNEKAPSPTWTDIQIQNQKSLYMMRRSKKQLNTLKAELDRGRGLLRNVKLGHGLFKVLQDEWTKTLTKRQHAEALEKERALMNWQPAKTSSDSESDSDSDAEDDTDISKYFVQLDAPDEPEQPEEPTSHTVQLDEGGGGGVRFQLRPETSTGHRLTERQSTQGARQMSAPPSTLRRRKGHAPRPYTPIHNNISQKKHHEEMVGETLFRQLCCLHWILKAMDITENSTMSPLITCWQLSAENMGGVELNKRQLEEKKQKEQQKYDNLFKVARSKEVRRSRVKPEKKRSVFSNMRTFRLGSITARSRSGSLAQSQTSVELPYTPLTENYTAGLDDARAENDNSTINEAASPDSYQNAHLRQVVVAAVAAAGAEEASEPENTMTNGQSTTTKQPNYTLPNQTKSTTAQLTREEIRQQEIAKQLEEAIKANNAPMERLSHSRMYKATDAVKPKYSKELQEFKVSCRSSKLMNHSAEMRQNWAEVKEEKALRLHDELDYQEKNRLNTCQNKFSAMNRRMSNESSFHRALKHMRIHSEHLRREAEKEKNKKQDQSKYAVWFDELVNLIPEDCAKQWYFVSIIDKLRTFGITESSSKASEHKFTRVLKFIRTWEICSPNVAAAVEFCRDRVVEMSEEDFEELFQHLFPMIERPKTAPAKSNSGKSRLSGS